MRINIAHLRRHPGQSEDFCFCEELEPFILGGETITFVGPVRVEGTLTSGKHVLTIEGSVCAKVRRDCCRCLTPIDEDVVVPLAEELAPVAQVSLLDTETKDQVRVFNGDQIDLREAVLEAVSLALPMKVVCRPDCPGLCPRCGRTLSQGPCNCGTEGHDQRLAILRTLWSDTERR